MKKREREHCLEVIKGVLKIWDPIGVIDPTNKDGLANNEYDSYAPGLHSALEQGKNAKGIAAYLAEVRSVSIGLGLVYPTEKEEDIGEELVAWRDKGYERGVNI